MVEMGFFPFFPCPSPSFCHYYFTVIYLCLPAVFFFPRPPPVELNFSAFALPTSPSSPPPQSQTSKRDSSRLQLLDSPTCHRTPQLDPLPICSGSSQTILTPPRKTLYSQAPSILSNQSLHLHPTSDCFTRLIFAQDTDSSSPIESAAIAHLLRTFR
jgi:hypothetical protein